MNDNNNLALSICRSLCKIVSLLWILVLYLVAELLVKYLDAEQTLQIDSARLLLSIINNLVERQRTKPVYLIPV